MEVPGIDIVGVPWGVFERWFSDVWTPGKHVAPRRPYRRG
jgi:hypothetical protein